MNSSFNCIQPRREEETHADNHFHQYIHHRYLIQVIQEHLSHFVHWNCGIYWTIQTEFTDKVRQCTNMKCIWKRQ